MNPSFFVSPPQGQADTSGSAWSNPITRRSFLKRTGGATVATLVAWNAISQKAMATEDEGSSSGSDIEIVWELYCVADPLSGKPNEGALRAAMGSGQDGDFDSSDDTPFDPVGPGDNTNSELFMFVSGRGPKAGSRSPIFSVSAICSGWITVNGTYRMRATTTGPISNPTEEMLYLEERNVEIWINPTTGQITKSPASGQSIDDDSSHWTLGYSTAELKASTAFEVTSKLSHDFRTAYTGSGGVSATFKQMVGLSANATVNSNDLELIEVTTTPLVWTILKVKKTYKNRTLISEEEFNID